MDVSASVHPTSPGQTLAQAVRANVSGVFAQNPALIDLVFSNVTFAACTAAGLAPYQCPNPPSMALALEDASSIPAILQALDPALVPIIAGAAVGGTLFTLLVVGIVWMCRGRGVKGKVSPSSSEDSSAAPHDDLIIVRQVVHHVQPPLQR